MRFRLIAILLLCSKLVFTQSTVTYYFNSSYKLVSNPKNATYRAEVTTLTKIFEGQADINVYTISDTLIQRYSYSDVKKGIRSGSLLLFYETGEPKRMIVYNTEGQPIEDKQFLQDGQIDVITKYQGRVITEYLHFYYPNKQLQMAIQNHHQPQYPPCHWVLFLLGFQLQLHFYYPKHLLHML
ncbi:MAG TPA: hypothetical protein PLN38_08755 [Chitinophagales bacterium]|nr:hypothetical protein [Chitinophagales bacterium]